MDRTAPPSKARPPATVQGEVLQRTRSLCPVCFEAVAAAYVVREGERGVRLVRTCPDHGTFDPVVWGDADHWRWARRFEPGGGAGGDSSGPGNGSGTGNGVGRGLTVVNRHACLVVLDVTTRCNLECTYCFAASGPAGEDLSLADAEARIDEVVASGGPRPLQLSGGEPTVHPELAAIVEAARGQGFDHVEVNTNGLRLAREDGYAKRLAEAGVAAVYLQFDGRDGGVHARMRGGDLSDVKAKALDRCREAGLPVVLACTVVEGINDDGLGDVLRLALAHRDVVRAVNFQPLARFGRYEGHPARLGPDVVARRLADQTAFLEERDLLPVPCCSPLCHLATLLVPEGEGGAVPVTRFLDVDGVDGDGGAGAWADAGARVDEAAWMEVLAGTDKGRDPDFLAACCGVEVPDEARSLLEVALPVGIVAFMDAGSADLDVLQNCCIAAPCPGDGLVPFCAYNMTDADGRYAFRARHGWPGRRRAT